MKRSGRGGLRSWHEENEHLLLYTAEAVVLPEVMNFLKPGLQETRKAVGSRPQGMPANCSGVQARLDHIWKVQLLQVFVCLLISETEFLGPGLTLRRVRDAYRRVQ